MKRYLKDSLVQVFIAYLAMILFILLLASCTDNKRARIYGGSKTVTLKENEICLNVAWKDEANLWVFTKDTVTNTYYYREYSNKGIVEGKVTLIPGIKKTVD